MTIDMIFHAWRLTSWQGKEFEFSPHRFETKTKTKAHPIRTTCRSDYNLSCRLLKPLSLFGGCKTLANVKSQYIYIYIACLPLLADLTVLWTSNLVWKDHNKTPNHIGYWEGCGMSSSEVLQISAHSNQNTNNDLNFFFLFLSLSGVGAVIGKREARVGLDSSNPTTKNPNSNSKGKPITTRKKKNFWSPPLFPEKAGLVWRPRISFSLLLLPWFVSFVSLDLGFFSHRDGPVNLIHLIWALSCLSNKISHLFVWSSFLFVFYDSGLLLFCAFVVLNVEKTVCSCFLAETTVRTENA